MNSNKENALIKLCSYILLFIALIFSFSLSAGFEFGVGSNTFTGGRFVPSLDLAYTSSDKIFAGSSTGVRSSYYYQSSYQAAFYKSWKSGTMWSGEMISGFGGAVAYSVRSFKDEGATATERTVSDIVVGPSLRMTWGFGFFYINMTATYGLRNLTNHLSGLTFQDVESLSLGFRF